MARKLWVVSELYYPEAASTGYILTRIAEGLAAKGHQVHVLCSQPTYSARGLRAPAREQHNGVTIRRCAGTALNKDVLAFRLINLLAITLSLSANSLFRIGRADTVLVVTNPPSLPFLVAVSCWLRRARCVLLIHDVYPDVAIAAGKLPATSALARITRWLHRVLYRSVAHIVVLGRDMRALVAQRSRRTSESITIITNWADGDLISPVRKSDNRLLEELQLQSKFVLQYAGNMGYPNDLESIVEAATILSQRDRVHFLFIGSGVKRRSLEEAIARRGLQNVTILSPRPRDDQPCFLNACDVALISLVAGMRGVSVPSRTYNALAAGKPIIAITDPGSELALVVEEECIGWVVSPNDPEQLASVIIDAASDPKRLARMGARARKAAETRYVFDGVLSAYHELFRTLASDS